MSPERQTMYQLPKRPLCPYSLHENKKDDTPLFENSDQQDQNDDEDHNGRHLLILTGPFGDLAQHPRRAIQATLLTIRDALDLVQHGDVAIQLVANLHANLALAADGLAEAIELLVLLLEDLGVVLVQLLVAHLDGGVAVAGIIGVMVGVVAVGAEELRCWGGGGVAEAHRLGLARRRGRRGRGGVGKVGRERGGVGVRERCGRGGGGEAVELGCEVVVLFLQRRDGVFKVRGSTEIPSHISNHYTSKRFGCETHVASPASSNRALSPFNASNPSRNCSSDRDRWPSCVSLSRLRLWARWRSSRESLTWSARRKSWFGLDMLCRGPELWGEVIRLVSSRAN